MGHSTNKKVHRNNNKPTPWVWGPEHQHAFEERIQRLTPPVFAYADYSRPFILNIDAGGDGLSAILYQEQNGHEHVVAYVSRGLMPGSVLILFAN